MPNVPEAYVTCSKPGSPTVGELTVGAAWIEIESSSVVSSPPEALTQRNSTVCDPAATVNGAVWYAW